MTIGGTILFIDGGGTVHEAVQALFQNKGYTVMLALNSATGIAICRKSKIDAVIVGFTPTGKDANQVADVLAKEQPNLPVAISSDSPDDVPESLKWFADALLETGAAPETLLLAIERLIAARGTTKKSAPRTAAKTIAQLSA